MPTQVRDRKVKKESKKKSEETRETPKTGGKRFGATVISLVAFGVFVVLKFLLPDSQIRFARADQYSKQLVHEVKCSEDYKGDTFTACKPKFCGRVIRDDIVTEDEAKHLLSVAKKGLAYGGSTGGASILDLHTGALSKQDKFVNVYSVISKEDSFTEEDFAIYRQVKNKIHKTISDYFQVPASSLYLTKPTFFSRMNTSEAKTLHDEYWHPHIDRETYGSFHYTSLLYLSTYDKDFTGGRFIFTDEGKEMTVEPRLGRLSFFTSGSENVHYVEKLKTGVRYAITISFTCNPQMAIADPDVR